MTLLDHFESQRPKTYLTEWHDRWVCLALQRAYEERKNLIIEMHPRSGKSEKANVYTPAWWLKTHPEDNIGLVCSEDGLASKFVGATRNLLARTGATFEYDRNNEFKLSGTRSLDATYMGRGIHSNLSGRGFSAVHFDDVLKSGTDAMSEIVRERLWTDVASAAINRLTPDGIVIAMQARLHQQDVIGKLLDTGLKFLRLHLPATNDDARGAWFEDGYTGEKTNFPPYKFMTKRYPRPKLDEIFSTVTSYYWMSQYQQSPSLGEMSFFKTDNLPRYERTQVSRCWLSVDAAQTATKGGSYSAIVALGYAPELSKLLVLDVLRGRWRQDQLEQELIAAFHGVARQTGIRPEQVIVERAAAGYGLIDRLSDQLPILPLIPKGSKEDRAAAVCAMVNRGQVAFPKEAAWLSALIEELSSFPLGKTKDQVDALVHALSYVSRPSEFQPVEIDLGVATYDAVEEHGRAIAPDLDALEDGMESEYMSPATAMAIQRMRDRGEF
jgi:predicted phage terminase large subunit-like protein